MLYTMTDLLRTSQENSFAVGAFNICDSLLFKCVIEAAEENNAPVIIELAPPELDYVGDDFFLFVRKRLEESKVPCVLHLDHGKTLGDCTRAIRDGFTSVMIDGSLLSYQDNVDITKKVVEMAHSVGIPVEAEIGTIGAQNKEDPSNTGVKYTNAAEAKKYMQETGADTLAVAIGTAHGIYPKGFVPKLRLDILDEIHSMINNPLVLHGGSSNNDDEIMDACKRGINKVNIASDYRKAFFEETEKVLSNEKPFWTPKVYQRPIEEAKKVITHKMELFGCIGKAALY